MDKQLQEQTNCDRETTPSPKQGSTVKSYIYKHHTKIMSTFVQKKLMSVNKIILMTQFIYSGFSTISIVEDKGFTRCVNALNPSHKMLS